MRSKIFECTMYVVQKKVIDSGKLLKEFLNSDADAWTTFAACWKNNTRKDAVATLDWLSLKEGRDCEIVDVRCRTLSTRTRSSRKRTR